MRLVAKSCPADSAAVLGFELVVIHEVFPPHSLLTASHDVSAGARNLADVFAVLAKGREAQQSA